MNFHLFKFFQINVRRAGWIPALLLSVYVFSSRHPERGNEAWPIVKPEQPSFQELKC